MVLSLDIKDFYPHVSPDRVFRIFTGLGFGEQPARILTRLTTWQHQLPQGAPTSTALANLSLIRVDYRISKLAHDQGFSYTRYVDDLTISGGQRIPKFCNLVQRVIESEGFRVRPEKKATMHSGVRQVVTQLVVNDKLNLPREKRRAIRQRVIDLLSGGGTEPSRDSVLGQLSWLRYVNPKAGDKLSGLVRRALPTSGAEEAQPRTRPLVEREPSGG
jgi:retron-type reverse transcriptase